MLGNRVLFHGLIFWSFLAFVIGVVSCDSSAGRYQGLIAADRGLIMVDTYTGEAKVVLARGINSTQLGKHFKDMDAFPEKKDEK